MHLRDEALWSIKEHMTRVVPHMKVREVVADPLGLIPPAQSPRPCSAQATLINGTVAGSAPDNTASAVACKQVHDIYRWSSSSSADVFDGSGHCDGKWPHLRPPLEL
jgi:hypothetical protein